MPVTGYESPGHVPDDRVHSNPTDPLYNQPHVDLHNATSDAIDLVEEAVPQSITDLGDVDFTTPPATGRQLLERVGGVVVLGAETDPGGLYVPLSSAGQPNGYVGLDADGDPVGLTLSAAGHTILDGNGDPVTDRPFTQFVGFDFDDLSTGGGITVITNPVLAATDFKTAQVTDTSGFADLVTIPFQDADGNTLTLAANRTYRIDFYVDYQVTNSGQFHIVPTFPSGATVRGVWDGAQTAATDSAGSRKRPVLASGTGVDFGGYGATTTASLRGAWRIKTGSTGGAVTFQFSKKNIEATVATVLAESWLDVAVVR